jgi:hypothetical protein
MSSSPYNARDLMKTNVNARQSAFGVRKGGAAM